MISRIAGPIAACIFVAFACAACTIEEVAVRTPPPADREEVPSAAPSAEHFWVRGHWRWVGHEHVWTPGHWEARRPHEVWVAGHWRSNSGSWVWIEGRWAAR